MKATSTAALVLLLLAVLASGALFLAGRGGTPAVSPAPAAAREATPAAEKPTPPAPAKPDSPSAPAEKPSRLLPPPAHGKEKEERKEENTRRDAPAQPAPLSRPLLSPDRVKKIAEGILAKTRRSHKRFRNAELNPLVSSHPDFSPRRIVNPLRNHFFWSVLMATDGKAPLRSYLAVSRTGDIYWPYSPTDFKLILRGENTAGWNPSTYMKAAELFVHLTSPTSQDGWKVLAGPEDLLKTLKKRNALSPAAQAVAGMVSPPAVKDNAAGVLVTFCSWHWAGGVVAQWRIQFGKDFHVRVRTLGACGGGKYK